MELEVIRAHATGLQDATIGINAMIDALTLDIVTDTRPSHVTVYNYVDHSWVARKKVNHDEVENARILFPAVAVYLVQPPTFNPIVRTGAHRDGDFPIALSYFTIEPDEAKRMRDALYTNRAMNRFLKRFDDDANAPMRTRNGVNLFARTQLTQYTPFVPWEAAILAASTVSSIKARETSP